MEYFYKFIRSKRIEKGFTLRTFCRECQLDPSNWSKVENGIANPPKSKEILIRINEALKLTQNEYLTMLNLATIESIPHELFDQDILTKLPLFLRTIRGEKLTETELKTLYGMINRAVGH